MKPIYKPKGAAAEYADYALNIYTGCSNGCTYCYAPGVLRKTREEFRNDVRPRLGLIDALHKQLEGGNYEGKTIHLCFTCDPYPEFRSALPTRDVIEILKHAGCHVQILTKNLTYSVRDWGLLDNEDWIGTTISGDDSEEPYTDPQNDRMRLIKTASKWGFRTWISFEPVLNPKKVLHYIAEADCVDLIKIGKLNHQKSFIDWQAFGEECERLCKELGRNYVIKEDLRTEMDRD